MQSTLKLKGRARIRIKDKDGNVVKEFYRDNLITVVGFTLFAQLIADEAVTAPSHMAVGDSSDDPESGQTDLQGTELARTTVTTSRVDNEITYTADFSGIGADIQVSEFGIFNDASAGTMIARFTYPQFTLFASQSMDIDWTMRVGQ